jgi:hypothetical protein
VRRHRLWLAPDNIRNIRSRNICWISHDGVYGRHNKCIKKFGRKALMETAFYIIISRMKGITFWTNWMHSPIITIIYVNFVMHGMENVKLCKFLSVSTLDFNQNTPLEQYKTFILWLLKEPKCKWHKCKLIWKLDFILWHADV